MPSCGTGEDNGNVQSAEGDDHHQEDYVIAEQVRSRATNLVATVTRLIAGRADNGPAIEFYDDLATADFRPELTKVYGLAHGEPHGQQTRGSHRGNRLAGSRWLLRQASSRPTTCMAR